MLLAQMATESSLSPYFAEVAMRCGDMKRHELFHSELVEEPVKTRWMKMMLGPSPSGYHQGAHQIPGA